ncbi:hypothetical protein Vadar_023924 [Vaccinium darrowii]|uniref:Uncharacterized protein n=1 Tax=Vaccinium darrowii TaxID=229202 RepID=A0ACB7XKP0_9ERIC|nr:hypothetical protein Vadar_023924 [Vaccinium darrowii]
MYDIFQEFGLQCFDGYKICEMQSRERIKRNKGLASAFQELNGGLRPVCEIHELPLAMTWVPCSACNGLLRGQLWSKDGFSTGVEFCADINSPLTDFLKIGKSSHLRKGLVARRALSSLNMLYCSDITQLSVDEYPLVPYARRCKLSGWFTICLQSFYTGNDIYVLEFFLPARSKVDENIPTKLSFILGTMEKNFKTFRLASGKELGELMSVDIIDFQNDQKMCSVQSIQATRDFSILSSDLSSEQSSASVSN